MDDTALRDRYLKDIANPAREKEALPFAAGRRWRRGAIIRLPKTTSMLAAQINPSLTRCAFAAALCA